MALPENSNNRRTFNYTDLPTFGNRFFAFCEDFPKFLTRLPFRSVQSGNLTAFFGELCDRYSPVLQILPATKSRFRDVRAETFKWNSRNTPIVRSGTFNPSLQTIVKKENRIWIIGTMLSREGGAIETFSEEFGDEMPARTGWLARRGADVGCLLTGEDRVTVFIVCGAFSPSRKKDGAASRQLIAPVTPDYC